MLGLRPAKTLVLGDRQHDRRVYASLPDHDRLALRLLDDFIQPRLGFRLIDRLHDAPTLRAGASVDPEWERGLA
jgi:hypothetical protein